MSTLITFLGKGQQGGYQKTNYRFPDGTQKETSFFGLAAAEVSQASAIRILGTSGSMWDVLTLEYGNTEGHEAEWDQLAQAVAGNGVTQAQLDAIEKLLNHQEGPVYTLRIIPYGQNDAEQVDILRAMIDGLEHRQGITLDITHSFRHLPMLGLLAAFYLRAATEARIEGIYYGAKDSTQNGVTPVLRLDGLLTLYDWIRALEQFNKDGDYSSFSELFDKEQLPGKLLREAAFMERVANATDSRKRLTSAMQKIAAHHGLSPAATLFAPLLEERTEWHKRSDRATRERVLANDYLQRRDYLRATQFGYESFVTAAVMNQRGNPDNREDRVQAEAPLYEAAKSQDPKAPDNFGTLKNLRNALAHGTLDKSYKGNKTIQHLISNEDELHKWLTKALR